MPDLENDIGIYFEYENTVIQFPINPEKIDISSDSNNTTENIINLGDINLIKTKKLFEVSWESWLPSEDWFPAIRTRGEFKPPQFYLDFIEKIRNDKKPFRLVITGIGINSLATIEKFSYKRQSGDFEDTYYDISLKEYREYGISKISIDNSGETETTITDVGTEPQNTEYTPNPTDLTIGCNVILNGQVFRDSYGNGAGNTYTSFTGKINLINKEGTHPYHVTTPNGDYLGWVTEDSVVLA